MTRTKKRRKMYTGRNTVITLVTMFVMGAVLFLLQRVTAYATIAPEIFTKLNIAVFGGLIILAVLSILTVSLRNKILYVFTILILAVCTAGSGYGIYALGNVERDLENLTKPVVEDSLDVVLLFNSKSSSAILLSEEDLTGKKVAVPAGTQLAEGVRARFSELSVNPEYLECESYQEAARYLISGDVDCAAMPGSWESILHDEEGIGEYLQDFSVLSSFNTESKAEVVEGADKDLTTEPFTILLEGDSDGLSDTIMIVTVNPQSMEITMTSIARDSYVPITCSGYNYSKINAAHMYGGMGCMIDTVGLLTGLDFDYYVEVNFQGIVSIVDALGGIEVDNYTEFVGQSYTDELSFHDVDMPVGTGVHLNGEQALAWVRERKAFDDGDFARQRHQQEFLKIVLEKVMATRDINVFLRILEAAGDNLTTNMSVEQMSTLLKYGFTKSARYYNQDSLSNIFHMTNWRVTGYDDMQWNEGLQMNLYIYRIYDPSVTATYYRIQNNLDNDSEPSVPDYAEWDAEEGYETPNVSYDYSY